jgi:biopolymer transport protein ExbD
MTSLGELQGRLLQLARIKSDAPVVLHPDPDVPLEHVIDVFDMSRLVGFQKVQFAVSAP